MVPAIFKEDRNPLRRWLSTSLPSVRVAMTVTAVLATLLIAWEVTARYGLVSAVFISSPGAILSAAAQILRESQVQSALTSTFTAIGVSFVLGASGGICAGLVIGASRIIRQTYFGVVLFILSTPKVVFIPLFLLVFGIGTQASIAFGTFEAFFYVTVNVVGGVSLVEEKHRTLARAFGASKWHELRDVILPAASPGIFAGLWYGIKHAFVGVLVVELFVSIGGLGELLMTYQGQFESAKVLALALTISIGAVAVGSIWNRVERRLSRWRLRSGHNVDIGAV